MSLRLSPAVAALVAIAALPCAVAQSSLDEVVVTATGRQADAHETPQAIEVLRPGQAGTGRAAGSAPVGALFRGGPGLAVQSDGAWGQNPVLRGLKKESIVVLVDGVRVNSAQPQGAIASFLDLGLLDRAEVVKGPASVLYGSGALGGVVNLITPAPRYSDARQSDARLGASWGSVDSGLAGAMLLRHSTTDYGLVVGLAGRNVDDYESPRGTEPRTGYRSHSALARYKQRLSDGVDLRLNLQRHTDRDVWYPGSARTGGEPGGAGIPPPLGTVTIRSPEQRRGLYGIGVDARLGSGELAAELYRHEVFRQIRAWSDRLGRDYVRNDVSFVTNGARARYTFPLGEWHLLTVGAETWRMKADPERYIDNNPPRFDNDLRNDPFDRGSIDATGLFVQDEFELGRTRFVAGARFDRVEGDASRKGVGPAAQTSGLSHSDTDLSWSIGAIHPLGDSLNLYANLGRAYRAADMRERFEDSARGDGFYHVGNPQLQPERSTSVEIGVKGRSRKVDYRAAVFHTRIDDYIAGRVTGEVNAANGLPIKRTGNLDEVVIRGVEGALSMPVGPFVADAAFTWLRGENRQDDEPLYQMPPAELRLGIGQPAAQGFYWRTQLRAVARQDRVATRFSGGTENETAGFATADARFGWRFGRVGGLSAASIDLRFLNLFDRQYHEHLTDGISGRELPAPGRGVLIGFSAEL